MTYLRAVRQFAFAPTGRTGPGCAMLYRFPSPGLIYAVATLAPARNARLRRLSLALTLVGAARHRFGRRFSYRVRVWTFSAICG